MDNEFRISAAAELVQVHADALAVGVDPEGNEAIEQRAEQVGDRQHQSQQGSDSHELREELAWLRREEARSDQSPEAASAVDGNGTRRIVE